MNDFFFQVADAAFHLHFNEITDARPLLPSYAPFYIKDRKDTSVIFDMTIGDNLVNFIRDGEEIGTFDCGGINHGIYKRPEGGYFITITDVGGKPACAMETSADFSECRASLFGGNDLWRFGLNNALMIAFAFAGAHHDILLMHASVTMKDGYAYLFLGKSGTGKSTHSRLWREHIPGSDLLNDDNPAVRIGKDGSVSVYGTPWSGKTPCYRNLSLPVGAFLRLEQYSENVIFRETGAKSFASVFSSCSSMMWDKPSYNAILNTVSRIASSVPVYYLKCRADKEAALLSFNTIASDK